MSQEKLSSGFATRVDSNRSAQLMTNSETRDIILSRQRTVTDQINATNQQKKQNDIPSEDLDQPEQAGSLIRVFATYM